MPIMDRDGTGRNSKDWLAWHDPYKDESSPLSDRLRTVQEQFRAALIGRSSQPTRIVSVCAGQGDDVLGVLASIQHVSHIQAHLVELDARNVTIAQERAKAAGLGNVTIVEGDASLLSAYVDVSPADIVLMCGVFGNIPDPDVFHTIETLPQLLTAGGRVIWTRSRRAPDLLPQIRRHVTDSGFAEQAFIASESELWSVGVNAFRGEPQRLQPEEKMFTFKL